LTRELPKVRYQHVVRLVGLKLIVIPIVFLLYFYLAGQTEVLAISVLEAGMPMAIMPFILAELYPMEREIIAIGIVVSSVLSIFTLPLLMVLVRVV